MNKLMFSGGGGFTPGIVFNPSAKGVAYARTDIGGAYRLNSDDTWTPLMDWANNSNWYVSSSYEMPRLTVQARLGH